MNVWCDMGLPTVRVDCCPFFPLPACKPLLGLDQRYGRNATMGQQSLLEKESLNGSEKALTLTPDTFALLCCWS